MRRPSRRTAAFAFLGLAAWVASIQGAFAVELIKDLDCALISQTQADGDYCLKVINTCNTPIVSRIEEKGGGEKDSAQIPKGERTKLCTKAPFTFLGSYIAGPLATGAGD